jgi:hypothetical protein
MNDELFNEYKKILDWIDNADHHKIKTMKPSFTIPDHVKKTGEALTKLSKKLRHESKDNIK